MAEEMIERVAKATREAVKSAVGPVSFETMSLVVARAAIEAMREPTIEMIGAGHNELERALSENTKQTVYIGIPVINTMWPAMIAAAPLPHPTSTEG